MSNPNQEDVLEKSLRGIFGIIDLFLIKEIRPAISGHEIIGVIVADICPMPAVTDQ